MRREGEERGQSSPRKIRSKFCYVCVPLHWNDDVGLSLMNSNTEDLECTRADDNVETWPRAETKGDPKPEMLGIILKLTPVLLSGAVGSSGLLVVHPRGGRHGFYCFGKARCEKQEHRQRSAEQGSHIVKDHTKMSRHRIATFPSSIHNYRKPSAVHILQRPL